MVLYHQEQPEIKNILIDNAVSYMGFIPKSFNTIALRLIMLAEFSNKISDISDHRIVIPTKNYIAVYGAENGNNSGSYISIKKTVKKLDEIRFFKSISYMNLNSGKATFTTIELYENQLYHLINFLGIAKEAAPFNFQKLRSHHAIRLYLFINYVLNIHQSSLSDSISMSLVVTAQGIKKILGMSENDCKMIGNLWGLLERVICQINQYTNIKIVCGVLSGHGIKKRIQFIFGYK